mmetsp:Transcript_21784/g.60543  ORF Transcript_21784/g.60543 Transcript_21784/m.60543 type:complete len:298 (+) Transcript_21784:226-1119(+)|eukprot:CAMPEP_0117656794 /NCGR_PEP_ID=MMETSP0804-20121206/4992_1 /TAXON_ID=1074897 /ORGANISM="Tetraselmis astigmatica, Strain CCMP880" /LENGTH=297 /DNA_ID=CAMNT_0005463215 /DNA_START=165 /DNA_END=1058 /DNA_ORIENTATION=+
MSPRSRSATGRAVVLQLACLSLLTSLDSVYAHGGQDDATTATVNPPVWGQQAGEENLGSVGVAADGATTFGGVPGSSEEGLDGPVGHSHSHSNTNSTGLRGGNIPHILVVYYSQTNHTKYLANIIWNGALDLIPSCHIEVLPLEQANYTVIRDWADVLAVGSPVLHQKPAEPLVAFLEGIKDNVPKPILSKLRGASFVTGAGIGGGQELVIDKLNSVMASIGINPLQFPDCRYQLGLAAITGLPPFCRQGVSTPQGCQVAADSDPGQIHPKFEAYGYEYGRQLVNLLADPNAAIGPY